MRARTDRVTHITREVLGLTKDDLVDIQLCLKRSEVLLKERLVRCQTVHPITIKQIIRRSDTIVWSMRPRLHVCLRCEQLLEENRSSMSIKVRRLHARSLLELGPLLLIGRDQSRTRTILANQVTRDSTTLVELKVIIGIIDDVGDLAERLVGEESRSLVLALGELDRVELVLDTELFGDVGNSASAGGEGDAVNVDSHLVRSTCEGCEGG